MSTTGLKMERVVRGVLLGLWRGAGGGEVNMRELLRGTGGTMGAVREALVILRERGCVLEQRPTGVSLTSTGLSCWQDVLEALAREKGLRAGRQVKVYQRTGSTNDVAWQFAGSAAADGLVVAADEQTAGRGRLGHAWVSKAGQSLLMSVLLRGKPAGEVDRMTLLAGLAAAEAVERAVMAATGRGISVQIKWPNDLLVQAPRARAPGKVAGILVERRRGQVVVGVGINVAQRGGDFPAQVRGRATSLYQATGVLVDRLRVAGELVERLDALCGRAGEGNDGWLAEWKSRCGMLGSRVKVRVGNRVMSGRVMDVDPLQGLMLRDETGGVQFLSAQTATLAE